MNWKLVYGKPMWLLLTLLFITARVSFAQETEASVKEKAEILFNAEKFVEATPLYLHLVALNPRSTDYNYKYGTCLLFNSLKKQDAFKYLNYSITDPEIASDAYFYLGKAYHLNFQFDEAIKNYNIYLQKAVGKVKPTFEVARQIEMCENGKKLLSTIFDIIVYEKKEIDYASFFRLYNLSNIGGVILINSDYQSKVDKKRNHIPLIHFPDKAQIVYYASYGETDRGHKDIYCRKKLPDGKWGLPQLVAGTVNTDSDEDFPYLSPNGEYLYFSSKGHNSMGGYDIFRSKINQETGRAGAPENLDFAISSPDNDLFYVVDSLEQNAYFASTRQSTNGKIHVYKVRVDRVPFKPGTQKTEDLIAAIQAKSELNVNVNQFNLNELDAHKENQKALASIGLEGASNQQIIQKFEEIQQKQELKLDALNRLNSGAINALFDKATLIENLHNEIKKDVAAANSVSSHTNKNEMLLAANEKVDRIQKLKEELQQIKTFIDTLDKQIPIERLRVDDISELTAAIRKFVISDQMSALKELVTENMSLIQAITEEKDAHPVDKLLAKSEEIGKQKEGLEKQLNSYQSSATQLENEIKQLRVDLSMAKTKDKEAIQSKIDNKESELNLVAVEIIRLENKISELIQKDVNNTKAIAFINQIQQNDEKQKGTKEEALKKVDAVNSSNLRTVEAYVKQQVKALDLNESNTKTSDYVVQESQNRLDSWEKDYELAQDAVDAHNDLTDEERLELKIKNNEQLNKKLAQELSKIEEALAKQANDPKLLSQKNEIVSKQVDLEQEKSGFKVKTMDKKTTPLTAAQELTALMPNYHSELKAATAKSSKEEQLRAQNEIDERLIDQIDEKLNAVYDELVKNPLSEEFQEKKEVLTNLKKSKEQDVAVRQQSLETLEQEKYTQVSEMQLENEVANTLPSYQAEKTALEKKGGANKLEDLNILDSEAVKKVDQELSKLNSATDPVSEKRKELLEEFKNTLETEIANRAEEIAKQKTVVETLPVKNDLLQEVKGDYERTISEIEASESKPAEKNSALLQEETRLLKQIDLLLVQAQKQIGKTPNDSELKTRIESLNQLKTLHEAKLDELEQTAVYFAKNLLKPESVRQEVLPIYQGKSKEEIPFVSAKEIPELLAQEQVLQTQLEKQIQANEKIIAKGFSAEKIAENQVLNELLDLSKELVEELKGQESKQKNNQHDLASLKDVLGSEYGFAMRETAESKEQALKQLQILNELLEGINVQLEDERNAENANEARIAHLGAQMNEVSDRKSAIENTLKTADQNLEIDLREKPVQKLTDLKEQEKQLTAQLNTANTKDKVELEKQLKQNQDAQKQTERIVQEIQLAELVHQENDKRKELEAKTTSNPLKEVVLQRATENKREEKIQDKIADLTLLNTAVKVIETNELFAQTQTVFQSESALKEMQRRLVLEVGEIDQELSDKNLNEKIQSDLQTQKQVLSESLNQLEIQIQQVQHEKAFGLEDDPIFEKAVSIQEEAVIVSDLRYSELRSKQQEINEEKLAYNETKHQLDLMRKNYASSTDLEARAELAAAITSTNESLKQQLTQIQEKETAMNQALETISGDKEAWKNVLTRGVPAQRLQTTSIREVVAPEIGSGFEIKKAAIANTVIPKTIPMSLKTPQGLVYRVQVGAFAKPIPENLFREFTPVTGEKLDNGITRYLAGYFGNRQKVLQAQQEIRNLGYNDAFVVAYCDGKRISLAEARRLEEQNLCKAMNQDSIVMQLIESTIEQLPEEIVSKYKTEPKVSDYNKAPGAVIAFASEEIKGLFYTVQVGVYNRPATQEQLRLITPLVTLRLENGQIRYSTGTFKSVDAARPKKSEAIERGITDAFITAYYNGERISLQEAKRLLEEQGEGILFKEEELPKVEMISATEKERNDYIKENPFIEKPLQQEVVLVSEKVFETYPRKELNQLRMQASFYYDQNDGRIKSFVNKEAPHLIAPGITFDTLVQEQQIPAIELIEPNQQEVVAVWEQENITGAWSNWLLRLTLPYDISREGSLVKVKIAVKDELQYAEVTALIRQQKGTIR